jgi:hypothetical protein
MVRVASLWKRLLAQNATAQRSADHPRLGRIDFDPDEALWIAKVRVSDQMIRLLFAGETAPDERLVLHGESILADFDRLALKVHAVLQAEAASRPRYAEEIRELVISDVCLLWPDRPDDGMIYFSASDRFRVWHCDYIDRVPQSLTFDS